MMGKRTALSGASRQDTRARLIECAFDLFSQRGMDKVNMDAIAAAAQVTKGSLYWHFKSKKEVIIATCEYYYASWERKILDFTAPETSPFGKLQASILYSVRACLFDDNNRVFTMEVLTLSLYDEEIRKGWASFLDVVKAYYARLVTESVESGELDCPNPLGAVEFMLSAMEGFKLQAIFEPRICSRIGEQNICHGLMEALRSLSPVETISAQGRVL